MPFRENGTEVLKYRKKWINLDKIFHNYHAGHGICEWSITLLFQLFFILRLGNQKDILNLSLLASLRIYCIGLYEFLCCSMDL